MQVVRPNEAFLTEVRVDDMTRGQLEIRAIRMILDSPNVSRRNLPAVSASFREIADIERIDMFGYDLRVVPACVNLLTGLRVLVLAYCGLNRDDSFPDTLWQLTGLEKLRLCDNNLTSIPSGIGQLSSLTYLSLDSLINNDLKSIPSQIGQLSSLIYLNLSGNNLVSLPDEIYQLTNLTKLHLHCNKLESISEEIGKLTNLTKLHVCNNQLTKLPKSIGKLVNLGNNDGGLLISNNPLTSLPDSIRKVKHALDEYNKKEYNLLLEDVETRAALRLQRRLVILLAKEPPTQSTATKDKKISFTNDVLKDPKLMKMICQYID